MEKVNARGDAVVIEKQIRWRLSFDALFYLLVTYLVAGQFSVLMHLLVVLFFLLNMAIAVLIDSTFFHGCGELMGDKKVYFHDLSRGGWLVEGRGIEELSRLSEDFRSRREGGVNA